jgi:hypothetical protein
MNLLLILVLLIRRVSSVWKYIFLTYKPIMFFWASVTLYSHAPVSCVTHGNIIRCRMSCLPDKQVYLMMFLLEVNRWWMIHKLPMECSALISLKASRWDIFYHALSHTALLQLRMVTATLLLNATLNATVTKVQFLHHIVVLGETWVQAYERKLKCYYLRYLSSAVIDAELHQSCFAVQGWG